MTLILLFSWGAVLVLGDASVVIEVSHDEHVTLWSAPDADVESLRSSLAQVFRREDMA